VKSVTDWSKVLEVFGSGVIGVFFVMILLMVLTQISTWVIDRIEGLNKGAEVKEEPAASKG
jgi:hypothetical protein